MRIELEEQEIVAIITNWAKTKYGTHNVSVEQFKDGYVLMQVTMAENDFGSGAIKITDSKFGELVKQMKFKGDIGGSAFEADQDMPVNFGAGTEALGAI